MAKLSNEEARATLDKMGPDERQVYAQELFNNPLFVGTLAELEEFDSEALLNTPPTDSDVREVLYYRVQVIRSLRTSLNSAFQNLQAPSRDNSRKAAEKTLNRG